MNCGPPAHMLLNQTSWRWCQQTNPSEQLPQAFAGLIQPDCSVAQVGGDRQAGDFRSPGHVDLGIEVRKARIQGIRPGDDEAGRGGSFDAEETESAPMGRGRAEKAGFRLDTDRRFDLEGPSSGHMDGSDEGGGDS